MTSHAEPQKEELKHHGDELENALKDNNRQPSSGKKNETARSGRDKE